MKNSLHPLLFAAVACALAVPAAASSLPTSPSATPQSDQHAAKGKHKAPKKAKAGKAAA